MEESMLKWAVSQGVGVVLAVVIFLLYRKDVKNGMSAWRSQTEILIGLTSESNRTNQALTDAVQELSHQLPFACPILADRRGDRREDGRNLHAEQRRTDRPATQST